MRQLGRAAARAGTAAGLGKAEFAPGRGLVMAIVNRTPDSFYRPGLTWDEQAAIDRVHQVVAEGADILDVGGGVPSRAEATRSPWMRRSAVIEPVHLAAVREAYQTW